MLRRPKCKDSYQFFGSSSSLLVSSCPKCIVVGITEVNYMKVWFYHDPFGTWKFITLFSLYFLSLIQKWRLLLFWFQVHRFVPFFICSSIKLFNLVIVLFNLKFLKYLLVYVFRLFFKTSYFFGEAPRYFICLKHICKLAYCGRLSTTVQ